MKRLDYINNILFTETEKCDSTFKKEEVKKKILLQLQQKE